MKTITNPKIFSQEHAAFLLHSLLEHVPDANCVKDREARYTLVDNAAAQLFKLAFPDHAVSDDHEMRTRSFRS